MKQTKKPLRIALSDLNRPKRSPRVQWVHESTVGGYNTLRPVRRRKQANLKAELIVVACALIFAILVAASL